MCKTTDSKDYGWTASFNKPENKNLSKNLQLYVIDWTGLKYQHLLDQKISNVIALNVSTSKKPCVFKYKKNYMKDKII